MSNAPAWLRCENCLWWISGMEYGEQGCNRDSSNVMPKSSFSRCDEWVCKRCFDNWYQTESNPVNHLYCKIIARSKPEKKRAEQSEKNPSTNPPSNNWSSEDKEKA